MDSSISSAVFIPDEDLIWINGKIIREINAGLIEVLITDEEYLKSKALPQKIVNLKTFNLTALPLQNDDVVGGVDDMTKLNYLHEASILYNLQLRFQRSIPYTYTGTICVAVNPYKWLDIYNPQLRSRYIVEAREALPPHVYGISTAAYMGMKTNSLNQSILVSGESGAGKTETVKILMNHIAQISGSDHDTTIEKVLKANPLLESFGNAKTTRNDNSSRFGKFIQLQFDRESSLIGSRCITYLLEKTRVVTQNDSERNFHIFHELIASPNEIKRALAIEGKELSDFFYTCMGDTTTTCIEGVSDADRFIATMETLDLLGVTLSEKLAIQRILAGILYMGQIGILGDTDRSKLDHSSNSAIETCASLLGLESSCFRDHLIMRSIDAAGETTLVNLSRDQAVDGRDAFAKEIYARLFQWLVYIINKRTDASSSHHVTVNSMIGLLDIFGFESFKVNHFEQLCINFANEKLQQKFTLDVLSAVQTEYREEDLPWESIEYKDNSDVLDMIEGRHSLLSLLNEECLLPRGSNQNFQAKAVAAFQKSSTFFVNVQSSREAFGVVHYAGKVTYSIAGFLERNKDAIANELRAMMLNSSNELLPSLFLPVTCDDSSATFSAPGAAAMAPRVASSISGKHSATQRRQSYMKADTVLTKFKSQLSSLMDTITQTNVHYVRCIKPNAKKSATEFSRAMVVDQLRCAGLIEAVQVSRAAYPNRLTYVEFIAKFRCLRPSRGSGWTAHATPAGMTKDLLLEHSHRFPVMVKSSSGVTSKPFELGRSKAFFSQGILELFENLRTNVIKDKTIVIQRKYRTFKQKDLFLRLKAYCTYIQSIFRCHRCYQEYKCTILKISIILRNCRKFLAKKRVYHIRRYQRSATLQAWYRMKVASRIYLKVRRGITLLNARVRTCIQRKIYLRTLFENRENKKMVNQLEAMKNRLHHEQAQRLEREKVLEMERIRAVEEAKKLADILESTSKSRQEAEIHLLSENEKLRQELALLRSGGGGGAVQFNSDSSSSSSGGGGGGGGATAEQRTAAAAAAGMTVTAAVVSSSDDGLEPPLPYTLNQQPPIDFSILLRNNVTSHVVIDTEATHLVEQIHTREEELALLAQLQSDLAKLRARNDLLEVENANLKRENKKVAHQLEIEAMKSAYNKMQAEKEKEEAQKINARYKLEKTVLMQTFMDQSGEVDDLRRQNIELRRICDSVASTTIAATATEQHQHHLSAHHHTTQISSGTTATAAAAGSEPVHSHLSGMLAAAASRRGGLASTASSRNAAGAGASAAAVAGISTSLSSLVAAGSGSVTELHVGGGGSSGAVRCGSSVVASSGDATSGAIITTGPAAGFSSPTPLQPQDGGGRAARSSGLTRLLSNRNMGAALSSGSSSNNNNNSSSVTTSAPIQSIARSNSVRGSNISAGSGSIAQGRAVFHSNSGDNGNTENDGVLHTAVDSSPSLPAPVSRSETISNGLPTSLVSSSIDSLMEGKSVSVLSTLLSAGVLTKVTDFRDHAVSRRQRRRPRGGGSNASTSMAADSMSDYGSVASSNLPPSLHPHASSTPRPARLHNHQEGRATLLGGSGGGGRLQNSLDFTAEGVESDIDAVGRQQAPLLRDSSHSTDALHVTHRGLVHPADNSVSTAIVSSPRPLDDEDDMADTFDASSAPRDGDAHTVDDDDDGHYLPPTIPLLKTSVEQSSALWKALHQNPIGVTKQNPLHNRRASANSRTHALNSSSLERIVERPSKTPNVHKSHPAVFADGSVEATMTDGVTSSLPRDSRSMYENGNSADSLDDYNSMHTGIVMGGDGNEHSYLESHGLVDAASGGHSKQQQAGTQPASIPEAAKVEGEVSVKKHQSQQLLLQKESIGLNNQGFASSGGVKSQSSLSTSRPSSSSDVNDGHSSDAAPTLVNEKEGCGIQ